MKLFCSNKLLEKHKEKSCSHFVNIVETKPTFVDCSSTVVAETIEPEAGTSLEFAMAPIQFHFNEKGELEPPIRNTFPKDQTDREYICYLCNRG